MVSRLYGPSSVSVWAIEITHKGVKSLDSDCSVSNFSCADQNGSNSVNLDDYLLFHTALGQPPQGVPPDRE